ncbi:endonuclease [Xanthomonas citri pv. mangiferaeindicae]|nr:endonuclease [Xanthomonas citri pv. mangiferaeindicae]
MRFRIFLAVSLITTFSAAAQAQVVTLNKGGYTLSYDCTNRAALRYEYVLQADTGSAARPSSFNLDTELPSGCAGQTSSASYASVRSGYDRGHLVTSNHMDYNATYIRRANLMSNIVPQVASFNQGIWVRAEEVAECYRDIASVQVYGASFTATRPMTTSSPVTVSARRISSGRPSSRPIQVAAHGPSVSSFRTAQRSARWTATSSASTSWKTPLAPARLASRHQPTSRRCYRQPPGRSRAIAI